MEPCQVVFILSTNYAGSHLLAQLLAAHSRCAGVGELHNYRKFRSRGSRSGNVVDDYRDHPAFAGLDALPVRQWHATILARLRETEPNLSHLIDNSKRPAWARRFAAGDARPVHLIRDPRALVGRWLRTYDTASAARRQRLRVLRRRPWAWSSLGDPVGVYLEKWLIANRSISRYLRHNDAPIITYHDLAFDTGVTLERLMPALGLAFESAQLRYGDSNSVQGTRKRDYLAATERSTITVDLRWQAQLTATQRAQIESHRGVGRYLDSLGLALTETGLQAQR